jgi:DnaK suppressor protein
MSKKLKNGLLKIRDELLKEIGEGIKIQRDITGRDVGDFYDDVDIEKDRQMYHMLGEREREKIKAIDEALEKIEDNIYGRCEECDEKINKERLKILPFAKYCVNCQAEIEKRARHLGQSGEDIVVYKDVSINDIGILDE